MKNLLKLSIFLSLCAFVIVSCSKDNELSPAAVSDQIEARTIEPAYPDLVVSSIVSSLPITNGPCPGGPMPSSICVNGLQPVFTLTATITNLTNIAVPAGTNFTMHWEQFGGVSRNQTIPDAIPGNGSITVTSPFFSLACPSGPPPFLLATEQFFATVDFFDVVTEFRENNNNSTRLKICHPTS